MSEIPDTPSVSMHENKKGNTAIIQNNNVQTIFGLLPTAYVNVTDSMGQKRNKSNPFTSKPAFLENLSMSNFYNYPTFSIKI